MNKWTLAAALWIGGLALTAIAHAEDDSLHAADLAPIDHAVELSIGSGYAQGFGDIAERQASLSDLSVAGGAVEVGVGYRLIPELALNVFGSGATFGRGDDVDDSTKLYSATAGLKADWHFLPGGYRLDPWVSAGTGWRGYWVDDDRGTASLQGWDFAKLQVGVDYRIANAVAVSPVLGLDLTTFFTRSAAGSDSYQDIDEPKVTSFVFAGVQARYDVSTKKSRSTRLAMR